VTSHPNAPIDQRFQEIREMGEGAFASGRSNLQGRDIQNDVS
jgi:hypothetical protein